VTVKPSRESDSAIWLDGPQVSHHLNPHRNRGHFDNYVASVSTNAATLLPDVDREVGLDGQKAFGHELAPLRVVTRMPPLSFQ
jgi:hypothetical protein